MQSGALIQSQGRSSEKTTGKAAKNSRKGRYNDTSHKRELVFKEHGQEYAKVTKILGGSHCDCVCFDGVKRLGRIRGSMRKRVWVKAQDIVLVSLRDYQDNKADIIHKYNEEEARKLFKYGEIPNMTDQCTVNDSGSEEDGGTAFEFQSIQDI